MSTHHVTGQSQAGASPKGACGTVGAKLSLTNKLSLADKPTLAEAIAPLIRHPLKHHRPSLECLRQQHADWHRRQAMFGGPYSAALIRLVMMGWIEAKPYDISSLAIGINTSRQKTTRLAVELEKRGLITLQRQRNRMLVHPTDELIELTRCDLALPTVVAHALERPAERTVG